MSNHPLAFDVWLWDIHREWNVAATLSLDAIGSRRESVALVCAWLCQDLAHGYCSRVYLCRKSDWFSCFWRMMNSSLCMNIGPDKLEVLRGPWRRCSSNNVSCCCALAEAVVEMARLPSDRS